MTQRTSSSKSGRDGERYRLVTDGGETVPPEERIAELEAENERLRQEKRAATDTVDELRTAVRELSGAMDAAADGDLTRTPGLGGASDDDVAAMSRSFDSMRTALSRTLSTAQEFAEDVDDASSAATSTAEDVRREAEKVNNSTANINDATDEQRQKIETVSAEMSNLSATIQEITSTAENVALMAEETAERGEEGQESAEQAIDELDQIQVETRRARESVDELTDYMAEIGDIVEFITDIAEQTNILALNANIEAARAGEAGSGFAVVADVVKSLAEETKDAAEEIEALIEDIREQTEETADGMETVEESVDTGSETVEEALDALSGIAEQAMETNAGVQEIKAATSEQADTAQEVAHMADDVADLSETTAEETERVATAIETHQEQFDTVVRSVKELSGQVTFLREELSGFDLDADGVTRATSADMVTSRADAAGDAVVVGSKMYTANTVLSYMVYELLAETTDLQPVADFERGKTQANFDGVTTGETDLYWSYTGTVVGQFLDGEYDPADMDETYRLAREIESEYDLVLGDRTAMDQGYSLSAPRVWCDETGVRSIPDLMDLLEADPSLTVAYESDFRDRDDGWAGLLEYYDVSPDTRQRLADAALVVEETKERYDRLAAGDADVIQGLTVDAWIDVHDLDVLEDTDGFFPSYQPVPLVHGETARQFPELVAAANRIGPTLQDVGELRRLVRQIKIGGKDPRQVARRHLRQHGLL